PPHRRGDVPSSDRSRTPAPKQLPDPLPAFNRRAQNFSVIQRLIKTSENQGSLIDAFFEDSAIANLQIA
ncbi:MAG: hypothetical protein KJN79_02555, partial [Gammaproteobacteria bacterium]|nr:hypothetical protein [Gammaproteobacteria bacterium]